MQDNESFICGFYCIAFTDYMLAGKTLLGYANLFSIRRMSIRRMSIRRMT